MGIIGRRSERNKSLNKRIKSHQETVQLEGNIGIPGAGVRGQSSWGETSIIEYEKHLENMRQAKEANPTFPIDNDFLKEAGHFYLSLSERGKANINFLLRGSEEGLRRKYPPGTAATWVAPYITTYLASYEEMVNRLPLDKRKKLPYCTSKPVGAIVTLSEYQGLLIEFVKHSDQISFGSWDLPVNGNIIDDNGQKHNIPEGSHYRAGRPKEPNALWKIAYGSEEQVYFSEQHAREHAKAHFDADVMLYCNSKKSYI